MRKWIFEITLKFTLFFALSLVLSLHAGAYRVHCSQDSIKVMELIGIAAENGGDLGTRIKEVAKAMKDIPYGNASDNDSIGTLMINLHNLDRLEFLNQAFAIALTSQRSEPGFKDYVDFYESVSRKKGKDDGFASRLFYGSDWIVDNVYRGNLKEMTEYLTGGGFKTKTLNYISRHSEEFPAMKDSVTAEKIKMVEMGYRSHRIPHLKKQSSANKSLHELMKDGDIIIMLSPEEDFDIYDTGIVEMRDGIPYLIHLPPGVGKVTVDDYPMSRLFKLEGQHFYGYRWLRPTE